MPSSKKEDKDKPNNHVFQSPNMSQSILSFLSMQDLAVAGNVCKQFQEDTKAVKEREEINHVNELKKFLKINETNSVYHINDYRQLLICQSVIKSLQQMVDHYIQNPGNVEHRQNGLRAIEYLSQCPLADVVAKCISQCICDSKDETLGIAEKIINEANNSSITIKAIRDCVYFGGKNAMFLAEKLIKQLSSEDAKLLNEIAPNQTETILTKCVKRNWLSTVSLLLDCKSVSPSLPNKNVPPQTPFIAAIQVSCERSELTPFHLFLKNKNLNLKINEKNALSHCMAEYDRLDNIYMCGRCSAESQKALKQLSCMEKIMKTLADHGFVEKQAPKSITKRFISLFRTTSTPAAKVIKKHIKSKSQKKKRGPGLRA